MAELQIFSNAKIAKMFPQHATEPFAGKVYKVDTTGSDDKPFKIHYEDGDKEWVTLAELSDILVDRHLLERARALLDPAAPPAPQLVAPSSRKRASRDNTGAAAAAAAAPAGGGGGGGGKKRKSAGAGGELNPNHKPGCTPAQLDAAAAAGAPAAAAARAGTSGGLKLVRPGARGAAAAGAAAAAHAAVSPQVSDLVSPAELQCLVDDVAQQAPLNANKMHEGSLIMRLPNKGPGTASLPLMSQGVSCGSEALFTVYGTSRGSSSLTPGGAALIDYRAEAADVLRRLDGLMESAGTAHKQLLTRVRVYLRNMQDGLPGFTQAWNSWVDQGSPPVLTVLQGTGPFPSAGVVLEARAYTGP